MSRDGDQPIGHKEISKRFLVSAGICSPWMDRQLLLASGGNV